MSEEYVYAGKGWEPKIGDTCEARSMIGRFVGWQPNVVTLVMGRTGTTNQGYPADYRLLSYHWVAKANLRKKIYRQGDNKEAEGWFTDDLRNQLKRKEKQEITHDTKT